MAKPYPSPPTISFFEPFNRFSLSFSPFCPSDNPLRLVNLVPFAAGEAETKETEVEASKPKVQAAALMLYNNIERLSYCEIFEQLNLSHEEIYRILHSLSCTKYKILIKEPMSKSICVTDVFEFNSNFTDMIRRIRILMLPIMDERKKVVEEVDKDRRYAIDAATVRIMKSRQVLGHQQLVSGCIQHLSLTFKPDIKLIKTRIEDLITRNYLKRDEENPNNFKYMA